MNIYDRYQRLREEIDSQNILDSLQDYFTELDLNEFCNYLEEEFNIEYNNDMYEDY